MQVAQNEIEGAECRSHLVAEAVRAEHVSYPCAVMLDHMEYHLAGTSLQRPSASRTRNCKLSPSLDSSMWVLGPVQLDGTRECPVSRTASPIRETLEDRFSGRARGTHYRCSNDLNKSFQPNAPQVRSPNQRGVLSS